METATVINLRELLRSRSPFSVHLRRAPQTRLPQDLHTPHPCAKDETVAAASAAAKSSNLLPLASPPLLLVGRIHLWNSSSQHSSPCTLKSDCLAFVDDSAVICCTVQHFDPRLLGAHVQLISWNYIPVSNGGACLEIREVEVIQGTYLSRGSPYLCPELADMPNSVLETPPPKQKQGKPRMVLAGCMSFISPPFGIPHGESRMQFASSNVDRAADNSLKTEFVQNSTNLKDSHDRRQREVLLPLSGGASKLPGYSQNPANLPNVKAPHSTLDNKLQTGIMQGFLVGLTACKHTPSCAVPKLEHHGNIRSLANCDMQDEVGKASSRRVTYVYFSGSPAAWRPILLNASGHCIVVTGLREKLVVAGAQRRKYFVYAATRMSIVALLCMLTDKSHTNQLYRPVRSLSCSSGLEGNGSYHESKWFGNKAHCTFQGNEIGSYTGLVTEIFVRGRLVELDNCVWLLSTHQPLSQVHGLRIGAMVSARHVHFLKVSCSTETALLLAACTISHIVIKCFSPLKTLYTGQWELQSCLSGFLESLPFSSTFWALQIIASLKQKFHGFYNDKEILGTTKSRGFAEKYIKDFFNVAEGSIRDVFKEFFLHHQFCRLAMSVSNVFSPQVPPLKNFCRHIQLLWHDHNSVLCGLKPDYSGKGETGYAVLSCETTKAVFLRRVISSKAIDVILLGYLQFSRTSGRLQLIDSTGAIDVVIPDLQSAYFFETAYQVTDYELVIEGYVNSANLCKRDSEAKRDLALSWVNNLKGRKFDLDSSISVSLFVVFNMKQATVLNHTIQSNQHYIARRQKEQHMPCLIEALTIGMTRFDLVFVVHKYPLRCKPFGMNTEICELKFSVEAIRLPFSLYISHRAQGQSGCSVPVGSENPFVACVVSVLSQSRNHGVIQSISKLINLDGKEQDGAITYKDFDCLMKEENNTHIKRLLFQSTTSCVGRYEVIQIGHCYLIEPLAASPLVHVGCQFWSLIPSIDCAENGRKKVQVSTCPLVDVVLDVPMPLQATFNSALKEAEQYLSPIMSVKDVLNVRKLPGHCDTPVESKLAAGFLVSFSGVVKSFHSNDLQKFSKVSATSTVCQKRSTSETLSTLLDVKDMESLDLIKVTCSFDTHVFPLGLGAGSAITVHRALLQWSTMGNVTVQSLPSTLIVVSNIKEEDLVPCHGNLINHKVNNRDQNEQEESTELTMISEIEHDPVRNLVKLHCRVLAVEGLLLELQESLESSTTKHSTKHVECKRLKLMEETCYRVTYASFVLDDGTGLASCLAKGDTAACLLNFPLAEMRSISSAYQTKLTNYKDTVLQLNALVRKYGTIWMQNIDPELDFPSNSVIVQGGKDKDLSFKEKRFFYGIVKRACHAGLMEIVAECQKPENADVQHYVTQMNLIDMDVSGCGSTRNKLLLRKAKPLKHELYLKDLTKDLSVAFQRMGNASAEI